MSLAEPLLPLPQKMLDPFAISKMNGFQRSVMGNLQNVQALKQQPREDTEYPNIMIIFSLTRQPTSLTWLRDSKLATSMQGKGEEGFDRCLPSREVVGKILNLTSFNAAKHLQPPGLVKHLRLSYPGVFSQSRGRNRS